MTTDTPADRVTTGRRAGAEPACPNSPAAHTDASTPRPHAPYRTAPCPRPYDLAHPADGQ